MHQKNEKEVDDDDNYKHLIYQFHRHMAVIAQRISHNEEIE